ncbi:MAG: HIRAN domain-containing protein [Clostridiales bacterium]|nr:HIRAN domain-containing protein [Candidatus Scatonaster coprocaballi]
MGHRLTNIQNQALTASLRSGELGSLLQPLVKEIHLFDTFVAGTMNLKDPTVLQDLTCGQLLMLVRETNKFDENEIVILKENGQRIGYIPRQDNLIFARLMDAGKSLRAKINSLEVNPDFSKIAIGIYMVDV